MIICLLIRDLRGDLWVCLLQAISRCSGAEGVGSLPYQTRNCCAIKVNCILNGTEKPFFFVSFSFLLLHLSHSFRCFCWMLKITSFFDSSVVSLFLVFCFTFSAAFRLLSTDGLFTLVDLLLGIGFCIHFCERSWQERRIGCRWATKHRSLTVYMAIWTLST